MKVSMRMNVYFSVQRMKNDKYLVIEGDIDENGERSEKGMYHVLLRLRLRDTAITLVDPAYAILQQARRWPTSWHRRLQQWLGF